MREYNDIDFTVINEWAKEHGFELDRGILSPLGYIDNNSYCSVYIAQGANCIFIDNFITNPKASPIEIKNSLRDLHKTITDLLLSFEGEWVVRITAISELSGILKRLGGIVDPGFYQQTFFIV